MFRFKIFQIQFRLYTTINCLLNNTRKYFKNMRVAQLAGDEESGEKSKTFVFQDEGHTLGNALRCIISSYPDVQFCGYTVPHPAESKMHFRIQMRTGRAIDTLKQGLEDLVKMSDHTLELFEQEMNAFKTANQLNTTSI